MGRTRRISHSRHSRQKNPSTTMRLHSGSDINLPERSQKQSRRWAWKRSGNRTMSRRPAHYLMRSLRRRFSVARPGTKHKRIIAMLQTPAGATIASLVTATEYEILGSLSDLLAGRTKLLDLLP